MGKLKGQDSTEYLVVLAGVLLVSFLILVLLGRSPSSSSSVTDQQLQAYWTGTTPFAISTAKVTNESISLAVSNTLTEQVYLTAIEAQDDSGNNGTILIPNKSFNAGEKIVLSNDSFTTLNPCTGKAAGSAYKLKSITFIYSQGAISGIRQQGTQPLMGACSGYVQSGESLTPTSTPIPESTSTPTPAPEFDCGTSVSFTYNGGAVTYGTVTSQAGKCWLDRNLGATQVANASDDSAAYGGLFQWGRLDDGHQARDSETTLNLSSTDNPGHSSFIDGEDFTWDWRSPQNDNLWQGTSGINNPCPSGWRVPTITEWQAEIDAGSWAGFESAYDSPLKLTRAGYRYGFVDSEGSYAWYWSSTVDGTNAEYLYFYDGDAGAYSDSRSNGGSVRCVSDTFSCGNNVTFTYRGGQVTYGTVESQAGKCFMDRNLGASQVANASDDSAAYGDLFEWDGWMTVIRPATAKQPTACPLLTTRGIAVLSQRQISLMIGDTLKTITCGKEPVKLTTPVLVAGACQP